MPWLQMYVKARGNVTPEAMKRIDDHLTSQFPAAFQCPQGTPIQEEDGTWEVRIFDSSSQLTVSIVKRILTDHYQLEIVREVAHE